MEATYIDGQVVPYYDVAGAALNMAHDMSDLFYTSGDERLQRVAQALFDLAEELVVGEFNGTETEHDVAHIMLMQVLTGIPLVEQAS